jgi:hypothetical protein
MADFSLNQSLRKLFESLQALLQRLLGSEFMDKPKDPNPGQTPGGEPKGPKELPWDVLTVGTFSGIDYRDAKNVRGLDGYFVWADLNGFAHLRERNSKTGEIETRLPKYVPVMLSLSEKATVFDLEAFRGDDLVIQSAYLKEGARALPGAIFPAAAAGGFFKEWVAGGRLREVIARVELDLPRAALLASPGTPKASPQEPAPATATSNVAQRSAAADEKPAAYSAPPAPAQESAARAQVAPLSGSVIAFIDDGCAFAHAHFLRGTVAGGNLETRVKRLWDQNPSTLVPNPAPAGYAQGREWTGDDLLALIHKHIHNGRIDEDAVYAEFVQGTVDEENRLARRAAHGTHVMDLACGPHVLEHTMCTGVDGLPQNPRWRTATDAASNADIIFVQLPMPTVQDTSGSGAMAQNVMDAINYIMSQCDSDARVVLNLSWGTLAGPHVGTSTLERFIDQQVRLYDGRLQVVIPAGNGYQSRTHANVTLPKNDARTLQWRVQPDDATESYLEIYTQHPKQLRITLSDPTGASFPPVGSDSIRTYTPKKVGATLSALSPTLGVFYLDLNAPTPPGSLSLPVSQGVIIALAPTVSLDGSRDTVRHGLWKVKIENLGPGDATVDAYIERDDVALGTKRGARQSYFEDAAYDNEAKLDDVKRSFLSDPAKAYARREGVFNSLATGRRSIVVGGTRRSDGTAAVYSPRRPYSARPKRPGTPEQRGRPLCYADSEESPSLRGVRAAGPRSGSTVRLAGTSDAAPQVARTLYNATAANSALPLPKVLKKHRLIPKKPV